LKTATEEIRHRYKHACAKIRELVESWLQRHHDKDDDCYDDGDDDYDYDYNGPSTNTITGRKKDTTNASTPSTSTATTTPSWIGNINKLRRYFVSSAVGLGISNSSASRSSSAGYSSNGNKSEKKYIRTDSKSTDKQCYRFPLEGSSLEDKSSNDPAAAATCCCVIHESSCGCYCYLIHSHIYSGLNIEFRKALELEAKIWYTADFDIITNLAKSNELREKVAEILEKEKKSKNKLKSISSSDSFSLSILSARILKLLGIIPFYMAEVVLLDIKKQGKHAKVHNTS